MNGPVHCTCALSGALTAVLLYEDKLPYVSETTLGPSLFIIGTTIGSTFPDLDLPGRPLGFLGHRRATHSFTTIPLISYLLILAVKKSAFQNLAMAFSAFMIGFIFGVISHLLLDLFQRKGIQPLWPLPFRIHLCSMPVKYDMLFMIGWFILLFALGALSGNLETLPVRITTSSFGVIIGIVIAVLEMKKMAMKSISSNKRGR